MNAEQLRLLSDEPAWPEGFAYQPDLISPEEEAALIENFRALPFKAFEFQGYRGNRHVVSFGLHYDFNTSTVRPAEEIPDILLPLRAAAARFAEVPVETIKHVLVTEYSPGAGIGWHRDRAIFEDVIGISLVSPCRFRLRRKSGNGWERAAVTLAPCSAYLLRGPVRTAWEHSIPPMEQLRYSVTFRTLRERDDQPA
ncbi:alpha-ketoglutarate-dependent dioxygenase AlkB [Rhodoligotrophos ferricapiens]|uniref:alpha-ketoglutarate-dependent dioxygenase AlkB n=1 Tax=Rhodoligotrophos ferricapiens TaxID=3069264 RepID=UPI00315DB387